MKVLSRGLIWELHWRKFNKLAIRVMGWWRWGCWNDLDEI